LAVGCGHARGQLRERGGRPLAGLALERNQVEYDLGSEDILARHGRVDGDRLVVGQCRYRIVVLPPGTENLNKPTADLLLAGRQNGMYGLFQPFVLKVN
jgi:hypothetical protein